MTTMNKIIVIAAGGEYPRLLVEGAKRAGVATVDVMAVKGSCERATMRAADHVFPFAVSESDKAVSVLIADNGVGMDEDTKRRMFDKYFRGDKSRSTPGNGLGLATVKKIAEVLSVDIKVDTKENVGTDFYMIFKK